MRPIDSRAPAQMPPWLWFWLGLFILGFPGVYSNVERTVEQVGAMGRFSARMAEFGTFPWVLTFFSYPGVLVDLLPPAVMLLGLVLVLVPQARRWLVERRYRLGPLPGGVAEAREIAEFAAAHASGVEVMGNLVRGRELAMVYPAGYRRTRLAVFGGLVRLWRQDRAAAEAVVLHELAHHRHGDVPIIGAGSLFQLLARYTVLGFLVCLALPQIIHSATLLIQGYLEAARLDAQMRELMEGMRRSGISVPPYESAYDFGEQLLVNAGILGKGLLTLAPTVFFQMLVFMVMPLAAIWSAELYADRFVVERQGSSAALERGLLMLQRRARWWRWLIFRLSHPPVRLRQWFARDEAGRGHWLLLMFPAAYLVKLAVLWGMAASALASMGGGLNLVENTRTYFATLAPAVVAAGLLVLAWPAVRTLATQWPPRVQATVAGPGTVAVPITRANLVCGLALLGAAALCLLLR